MVCSLEYTPFTFENGLRLTWAAEFCVRLDDASALAVESLVGMDLGKIAIEGRRRAEGAGESDIAEEKVRIRARMFAFLGSLKLCSGLEFELWVAERKRGGDVVHAIAMKFRRKQLGGEETGSRSH